MEDVHHRSGKLKQKNKPHKQSTRSKRMLKRYVTSKETTLAQSRKRANSNLSTTSTSSSSQRNKQVRREQANSQRKRHRTEFKTKRKLDSTTPRIVVTISLSPNLLEPVENFTRSVCAQQISHDNAQLETQLFDNKHLVTYVTVKDRFDTIQVLDACKVADLVCFVLTVQESMGNEDSKSVMSTATSTGGSGGAAMAMLLSNALDDRGKELLTLIKSQGLPTPIALLQGIQQNVKPKYRLLAKKHMTTFFEHEFGLGCKVLELNHSMETYLDHGKLLARLLSEVQLSPLTWRAERTYLLHLNKIKEGKEGRTEDVDVVEGWVRGRPLSVHQLLHLTGRGTRQIARISFPSHPFLPTSKSMMEHDQPEDLVADLTLTPSLKMEAEPNLVEGEQTWPTMEELEEADGKKDSDSVATAPIKDAGKEYVSAWGMDEEDEGEEEDELDFGPEGLNKPKSLVSKTERAKMDLEFPDEMDTPDHIPARERFARYRGLKSFRTSPWHPTESLPREYSFIHQLRDYRQHNRHFLKLESKREQDWVERNELDTNSVPPGTYCRIHLVPLSEPNEDDQFMDGDQLLVCGALFPYENSLSVLNCLVQPNQHVIDQGNYVESREPLQLHVGFWRREIRPVFSEHNLNSDKHKMERFLVDSQRWSVCSAYAPITFGTNCACLLFRGRDELVAAGNVHNVDANRIVLKKVVLTGIPFKVKKKWAVVRRMFYNPDDVRWFMPVELYTKYGASGRILEPTGTHGRMKCMFDRGLTQQDTICMALYKRIFPKRTVDIFPELTEEDEEQDDNLGEEEPM
ncbi:hypothetical protein BASA81_004892 [Batrachochytrium salamandrivorans]|nr:hypothetical protein BASA81_004892 [Batrachochytrium salamandrivorans]